MRNRYLEQFDNIIKVNIKGININNYLKRLYKKNINIIKIIPISYHEVDLILKQSEYQKLIKYKTIYQITITNYYGKAKAKKIVQRNNILLFFLTLGFIAIIFLSNIIFSVEVIHQDKDLRNLIITELNKYNLKKYTLKKTYQELETIEEEILNNNKDKLEWIEIIEYGTKYIIRLEERKINEEEENYQYQSIISKKNAVLVEIDATSGEVVKEINQYVKKGETIISGYITRPDNTKVKTMAEGTIYGEVWYEVKIDYPFIYQEINLTGNTKTVYVLNFLGKRISIFNFNKYKSFQSKNKVLISSNFLDISLIKEKQYEVQIKDEVYTEDIAKVKAIDYIKEKLKKDNQDIKSIEEVKILSTKTDEDSITFDLFVRAIENIGTISLIEDDDME